MLNKYLALFIVSFALLFGCKNSDKEILDKTISRLNSIEKIEYQHISHYVQKAMGEDRIDSVICYYDFANEDTLIGAKYQFISKNSELIFDGIKVIESLNNEKVVLYNNKPLKTEVNNSYFMINSFFEIKKFLPIFAIDTTVDIVRQKDTLINEEESYKFNISIKDRYISMNELVACIGYTTKYELYISKRTLLPIQFKNIYQGNKGFYETSFSNYKLEVIRPDSIWHYDRFPKDYLRLSKNDYYYRKKIKALTRIGEKASDWKLSQVFNNTVILSELKGDLVLLEFWFPGCRGCTFVIPELNEIQKRYSDQGLKVYGIEYTKPNDTGLIKYINKHGIEYPILSVGEKVARDYGVYYAPTFYLIDKNGIIKYISNGLDKIKLIEAIEENIKE